MIRPVGDHAVWGNVRTLYLGAGLLFLVNVGLGILNVLTQGAPPGRRLTHLHAGSIGWITLSVIATAVWVFTGQREVTARYRRATAWLTWAGIAVVAGYVTSFYLAFTGNGPFWLLALFGIPTALVIWAAFGYTLVQIRRTKPVTTVHLLLSGGLLVGSLAATMGVIWGLTYSTDLYLYPGSGGVDPVGAHAGPMDMYLALVLAALLELFVRPEDEARWGPWGMAQALLGVLGGVLALAAFYTGIEPLIPLGTLSFLASVAIYLARMGWRPFTRNPMQDGRTLAVFWGGLAFPIYVGLFVFLVAAYFVPGNPPPHALLVTFTHVTFVGTATNLVLATQSGYTAGQGNLHGTETAGVWLLNLGLLAFIAGEYAAQRPDGATIMALGALLALGAIATRMVQAEPPADTAATAR